jgi:UDP:flavonoid glycosyltransferase YjiC (YdhE family)
MVHELGGPPWATFGDGPLPFEEPGVPPFGPGLAPMGGPMGRLRDGVVRAVARRALFRRPQQVYDRTRAALGLPPDPRPAIEAAASPYLHLQGCTPGFEYPRRALPAHAHWVGAFRPDPPVGWDAPAWWGDVVAGDRPVVHVSQGSLRPDVTELVLPSLRGLADLDALVVVTTGGASTDEVARAYAEAYGGPLPGNARVAPFVPYDTLLARASVFVTNGGYSGVTMALHHGVPLVQAGTTEEKSEIAARIAWTGVGVKLGTTRPSAEQVGAGVRTILAEPSPYRAAAERVGAEMRTHDAAQESADLLERLAATGRPVTRAEAPASRWADRAPAEVPASAPCARPSNAGILAHLAQGGGDGGAQAAGRVRGEMGGEAGAVRALGLDVDLDPDVAAAVAVVDHRHGPGGAGPLLVVGRVVVQGEIDRLLQLRPPLSTRG